jgi:hypothetical protein
LGEIAENMGIHPAEITVVKMSAGSDDRHKELELLQGSWNKEKPWVIIDEEEHIYTLTSVESLSKIIQLLSITQSESFQLKLEKAIMQRLPIDFHDVWEVAMDRIRSLAQSRPESTIVNLDLNWLVSEIKQKYPNLFYNIEQILTQKKDS